MAININVNTLENKKAILGYDKRIFKGLHFILGYDFAKPYVIVSGNGKFTLNSIKQACEMHNITTDNTTSCILMEKTVDRWNRHDTTYLYLSIITCGFSKVIVDNSTQYKYKFNYTSSYGMDDFYRLSDFEDTRKTNTKRWYIVIQDKQYITALNKEVKVDYEERLLPVGELTQWVGRNGEKGGFYQGYFIQGNKKHYVNSNFGCKGIAIPVDKSGYWIPLWKSKQNQALNAYKANKRKNEADSYAITSDIAKEIEEIKANTNTLKHTLADMILNNHYQIVDKVMWKYVRICDNIKSFEKKLADKKYNSVSSIRYDVDYIKKYYNEVMEIINTNQTEAQNEGV